MLDRYPDAKRVIWLQDEPENMGAWNFVHEKLHRVLRNRYELRHVSRAALGKPGDRLAHDPRARARDAARRGPRPHAQAAPDRAVDDSAPSAADGAAVID